MQNLKNLLVSTNNGPIASVLVVFVLLGCSRPQADYYDEGDLIVEEEWVDWDPEVWEEPVGLPLKHASRSMPVDLIHTRLEVEPIWDKSELVGSATLHLSARFYPVDNITLDAKGMEILSIKQENQEVVYTKDLAQINVALLRELTRNDTIQLQINYIAKPEQRYTGDDAKFATDKGLYFINPKNDSSGHMQQVWTQGETESNSVWFPTLDSPNAKSTQEVLITVDNNYKTLSNGRLLESKVLKNGKRVDHWKQDLPHAPYLFMLAVGQFEVIRDQVNLADGRTIPLAYWVEPEWKSHAKTTFGNTGEMINFFSELLKTPFPWDKYDQIVVRDYVSGAMENTSASVFGDFVYQTEQDKLDMHWDGIVAHELFHQWFGDLVTCESWSHLPLNESFANYSEYLWDQHKYGQYEADYNAEREKRGYLEQSNMAGYHDLIWYNYLDKEQTFDAHSYNKGGRILHMLRYYVGDEAFFESLRTYLEKHRFKSVEAHELRLAFEEVTGEDLNWFFDQWFFGKGHPVVASNYSVVDGQLNVTMRQLQELGESQLFRIPMDLLVMDEGGKQVHRIELNQYEQIFSIPVKGEVKLVVPDAPQQLLIQWEEEKPADWWYNQLLLGENFRTQQYALEYLLTMESEYAAQSVKYALRHPFWGLRLQGLQQASLTNIPLDTLKKIAFDLALTDQNSEVRRNALLTLSNLENSEDELNQLMRTMSTKEASNSVIASVLLLANARNGKLASELAGRHETNPNPEVVVAIADIYRSYGDSTDFNYFVRYHDHKRLNILQELNMLNCMVEYLCKPNHEHHLDAAYPYMEEYGRSSNMYVSMFYGQIRDYLQGYLVDRSNQVANEIELANKEKDFIRVHQLEKRKGQLEIWKAKYNQL